MPVDRIRYASTLYLAFGKTDLTTKLWQWDFTIANDIIDNSVETLVPRFGFPIPERADRLRTVFQVALLPDVERALDVREIHPVPVE